MNIPWENIWVGILVAVMTAGIILIAGLVLTYSAYGAVIYPPKPLVTPENSMSIPSVQTLPSSPNNTIYGGLQSILVNFSKNSVVEIDESNNEEFIIKIKSQQGIEPATAEAAKEEEEGSDDNGVD
jgi:hypothetical protein